MKQNPPVADDPMSGFVHFDNVNDVRPNDQIRVGDGDHFYEILSIREDDSSYVYDHENEEFSEFTKQELASLLKQDDSYLWTIVNREFIPLLNPNGDPEETLMLYMYAAEFPDIPTNKAIVFGWLTDSEYPPTTLSKIEDISIFANYFDLHDSINSRSDCFEKLFTEFRGDDLEEKITFAAYCAEYNTQQMFELNHDPTYDEEIGELLDQESESILDTAKQANNLYF